MAMGLKKRRRIQLIVIAVFFLIVASILIGFAFKDGIEFFRSPSQVVSEFVGILPDLFSEGTGMIASGRLKSNILEAIEILAKHDENYMPKEVADALKEQGVFQE